MDERDQQAPGDIAAAQGIIIAFVFCVLGFVLAYLLWGLGG